MKAAPDQMMNHALSSAFAELSTPLLADTCVRVKDSSSHRSAKHSASHNRQLL
jgi:hypothetical protein